MTVITQASKNVRLDRLLANMGYGSRREMLYLCKDGRVSRDGEVLRQPDVKISLTPDLCRRMHVDGEPIDPLPGMVVMVHKPLGMTCSHKEQGALVYDLFPDRWRHREPALSTIGRLDKETSGLLLLTDDGDLLHKIISPRNHVAKRYRVTTAIPFRGNEVEAFASGTLMLEGEVKPLLPASFKSLTPTCAHVTITEGRYHQIRRMFAHLNNEVIELHRESIGGLSLPDTLGSGHFRLLNDAEVASGLSSPKEN